MENAVPPPEYTIDDVLVSIRQSYSNPSIGRIQQVVLKDGPRTYRIATLLEILNAKTGELHHYTLEIRSFRKKRDGWTEEDERKVTLDTSDEIARLFQFLQAHTDGSLANTVGDQRLVSSEVYDRLASLIEALPSFDSQSKLAIVTALLPSIDGETIDELALTTALEPGSTSTLNRIATSARSIEYRRSLEQLRELVNDSSTREQDLQNHLSEHPWIFGSEYSELLDRRTWTRDDNLDFMVRRTVDDYLEIIEIKTPFQESLFLHDKSHDSYYPSSKLSAVIGQALRYIEEIERNRDAILAKDNLDTLKIRVRIIAGRNGDAGQQAALRNFNAHLHRIEVLTFDQLIRIGERVLSMLKL